MKKTGRGKKQLLEGGGEGGRKKNGGKGCVKRSLAHEQRERFCQK